MSAPTRRDLIHTLALPPGSDARALAEEVAERFRAASISGSGGKHEVQLMSPSSLVVLVGPKAVQFFEQPVEVDEETDEEHDGDDEEDDPKDTAEAISDHLARFVGLTPDDDDDDDENKQPLYDADELALKVVALLLARGLLELTTPRSQEKVEARVAHGLDKGLGGAVICNALTEVPGVAELYTSDAELDAIIAECRTPRAKTTARKAAAKRAPKPSAKGGKRK